MVTSGLGGPFIASSSSFFAYFLAALSFILIAFACSSSARVIFFGASDFGSDEAGMTELASGFFAGSLGAGGSFFTAVAARN